MCVQNVVFSKQDTWDTSLLRTFIFTNPAMKRTLQATAIKPSESSGFGGLLLRVKADSTAAWRSWMLGRTLFSETAILVSNGTSNILFRQHPLMSSPAGVSGWRNDPPSLHLPRSSGSESHSWAKDVKSNRLPRLSSDDPGAMAHKRHHHKLGIKCLISRKQRGSASWFPKPSSHHWIFPEFINLCFFSSIQFFGGHFSIKG